MFTYVVPGSTTAGDDINLDISLEGLSKVTRIAPGNYTSTSDDPPQELTIVDSSPGAGEVALVDDTTINLGDDTDANDVLLIEGLAVGSQIRPS